MYALARTWPAPEMPRPGCVWTHTLFIEFPDLASIEFPSRLDRCFVRPDPASWAAYSSEVTVDIAGPCESAGSLSASDANWVLAVLAGLYESPHGRVVAKREPGVDADALALRIWDQQWPRLRRSFRFCTLTTKDRSTAALPFDLQILPGQETWGRSRIPGGVETSPVAWERQSAWLENLLTDMRLPNGLGLRDTLRRLGADMLGGREAMPVFSTFHHLTSGPASGPQMHRAIQMVSSPGVLSESRVARSLVAERVLENASRVDDEALDFLWTHWRSIDQVILKHRLVDEAAPLWKSSKRRLLDWLRASDEDERAIAMLIVRAVSIDDLLTDSSVLDVPLVELQRVRPGLFNSPRFWALVDIRWAGDFRGVELTADSANALILGMTRQESMRAAVRALGVQYVLGLVQGQIRPDKLAGDILRWVSVCAENTADVAAFLSEAEAPDVTLLCELSRHLAPEAVPNEYGDDPWLTALLRARALTKTLPTRLVAFAFARGLGRTSRNLAELLQLSFDQVHAEAVTTGLPDSDWALFEPRLPWVVESTRWDRGRRLRMAVVGTWMERRLWPRAFAWIASDSEVFASLIEEAKKRWGGRRFLKSVAESLEGETDPLSQRRRDLILTFLSHD